MVNLDQAIKLRSKEDLDKEQRMMHLISKIAAVLEKEKVSIYEMSTLLANLQLGYQEKLFTELNNKKI